MANLSALSAQRSAGRERAEAGDGALREAEGVVPRGSEGCLCSASPLEMSDPSRSAFSQSPQGKGCFCSQLGGTEPFYLQGFFKFLRKSCAGSLGLPSCRHWCRHGAHPCWFPEEVARQAAVLCLFGMSLAQIIYIYPALSRHSSPACPREHLPFYRSVTERNNLPKCR